MGKVEHFEIPADDVDRAKAFYADVFGWTYDEWDADTAMIHPGGEGAIGGDIHKRDTPTTPTVVITVDSIDDALDAVIKAGGQRLGAIETLGDEGRYAYFTDPEGNRLGLWDDKKP
jgi:predicted enzyme related to lactoylglutathione lyase